MSINVFQDNIIVLKISDLMNLIIYAGTDGAEKWQIYIQLRRYERCRFEIIG